WDRQFRHLMEHSSFYSRRFREAGVATSAVGLADITRLPFSTKTDLKQAIDERPPFGGNLCVAPERVKRVYQTSGTSGSPSVLALTPADIETWTTIGTRTYFTSGVHEHSSVLSTFGAGPFVAGHTYFVLSRIGSRVVPVGRGDGHRGRGALAVRRMSTSARNALLRRRPCVGGDGRSRLSGADDNRARGGGRARVHAPHARSNARRPLPRRGHREGRGRDLWV